MLRMAQFVLANSAIDRAEWEQIANDYAGADDAKIPG
jgi:hypothetical protein